MSGVWFVFTDACFDPETSSGIGAMLVDSNGKLQHFFSQEICDELLRMTNVTSRKTAISELVLCNLLLLPSVAECSERSSTCCLY